MKSINTYRKVASLILKKMNKPVDKAVLYKLSHFLDKYEKSCHTGPDKMYGRYTIEGLIDNGWFDNFEGETNEAAKNAAEWFKKNWDTTVKVQSVETSNDSNFEDNIVTKVM